MLNKKIVLVCAVALVLSVLAVAEMGVSTKAASAVVIKGKDCYLFDGNGQVVQTTGSVSVVTSGGASHITCIAQVAPSSTGQAVTYNYGNTGEVCETSVSDTTGSLLTKNWVETVAPSGQATLTCTHPSKRQ